jgi:hypothetical protein
MRGRALMRDIRADVIKDVMLDHGGRALMRAAGGGGGQVAGDAQGITAFQLDIKCEGLSPALLARALAQASPGTQGLARVESQGDWSRRAREALAVGGLSQGQGGTCNGRALATRRSQDSQGDWSRTETQGEASPLNPFPVGLASQRQVP